MTDLPVSSPRRRMRKILLLIALVALVFGGFLIAWNNGLRDRFVPRKFGVVEPGVLYRSGQISPQMIRPTIEKYHIGVIVAMNPDFKHKTDFPMAEAEAAKELGVERYLFPLDGKGLGNLDSYVNAIATIEKAKRAGTPVLIHCAAGAQRTGGVIACYQMLVEGVSPAEAAKQMRQYGWDPQDNSQLVPFLNKNMSELAEKLVARGVLTKMPATLPVLSE